MLSADIIRKDFPILDTDIGGVPVAYLDNAATTQVPLPVLERVREHYLHDNANVHRGIHTLSERSTAAFEGARETAARFLGAESAEEIIFTQGTTDAINTVASGMRRSIGRGDSIVVTSLEHHSNFVPWQQLCEEKGARFGVVPCPAGEIDMAALRRELESSPKLVCVTQVSNLTGTVMPLREIIECAHAAGAAVLVDGAQGVRHEPVNVRELDCDFYCFSGHKLLAPTGIGVLYGKRERLQQLTPARYGGGMVDIVLASGTTFGDLPYRLEAGTPNYVGAVALGAAIEYIERTGREEISRTEHELLAYAERALAQIGGLRILGSPARRAGVISFTLEGIHPYDAASILDKLGIALRSGTHCAQPGLNECGVESAIRLSPAFYNTREEIDRCCAAIRRTMEMLAKWTKS